MTPKTRQHWVPQFYLRGFASEARADGNAKVWACHREGAIEPFQVRVENIAAEKDLYRASTDARLWEIEDIVGIRWPQIAHEFVDLSSQTLRKAVSLFVATLHLRNRARIAEHAASHDRLIRFLETVPADEHGRPAIDCIELQGRQYEVDRTDWSHFKQWDDSRGRELLCSALESLGGSMAQAILSKRWAVVVDVDGGFATSDAPVILRHPSRMRFSFRTQGTAISLPLSPTRFLVLDDGPGEQGYFATKPGFVEAMNYQTWNAAHRFLISKAPTDIVLAGIMRFADAYGVS